MKKFAFLAICALTVLAVAGCDHSTNSQPAPADVGIAITTPSHDSYVEGAVTIAASTNAVGEKYVEFYVDGRLLTKSTTSPWTCTWNTSGLSVNSTHTLTAVAYTELNAYTTSQPVVVKIR